MPPHSLEHPATWIASLSASLLLAAGVAGAETPMLTSDCPDGAPVCRVQTPAPAGTDVAARPPSAPVEASDEPLVLGNEDLGATRESLVQQAAWDEPSAGTAQATDAAAGAEQASQAAPVVEAASDAAPEGEVWVSVPAEGQVVATGAGAVDFSVCMERSIRGGNAFDESRRVCQAVFGGE